MARYFGGIAACVLLVACSNVLKPSPARSASELRSAPATVALDDAIVRLVPTVYRDFQPVSPPDGKPLIAVLRVVTTDGSALPASIRATHVWLLFGDEIWDVAVHEEVQGEAGSPFREWVVRGGPKWGPDVLVDVIVELRGRDASPRLLQAGSQRVQRTD